MRLLPEDEDLGWIPYGWTVYILMFLVFPAFYPHTSPARWAITIAATVVLLALYFLGYWIKGPRLLWIIGAMTLLGAGFFPSNGGAGSFFIYAAAFAAYVGTPRIAWITIGVLEVITVAVILVGHIPLFAAVWPVIFVPIIGGSTIHRVQREEATAKLRLAHEEISHLAKVAERERIARDLHDLLGHTLSLIILKSELASKLAERDVARARSEILDVERISREALAQVRSAVRGYRSGGLQSELDEAVRMLEAANIVAEVRSSGVHVTASQEAVLALAIREAVTNVVRHARATRCTISVEQEEDACTVTVQDDGRGGNATPGSGLNGMRERIEALDGTMKRDGSNGTTITITLPVASTHPAFDARAAREPA